MAHRAIWVMLALFTCFSNDCGTIASTCSKDPPAFGVYSGVRKDAKMILAVPEVGQKLLAGEKVDDLGLGILRTVLVVVDLPLSAVVDTLLLPLTIPIGW